MEAFVNDYKTLKKKQCKATGPTLPSTAESLIHRRRGMLAAGTRYHFSSTYCHICTMRNHTTHESWFNAGRSGIVHCSVHRGSYMSAHVLLNLSNELGKRDKMRGLPSILSLFRNEFNKFSNARARMLDSIYHMTLRLLWNLISGVKTL